MQQPGFQQAMSQVLSDPRMVDYLIQSQPQLQAMGPGIRQYMQSDEFRRTMTDPQMLRSIFEMNRMFSSMGMQVPGMPGGQQRPSFPAPGVTDTTPQHQQQQPGRSATGSPAPAGQRQQQQPQQQQQQTNPFANLFNPPQQTGQSGNNASNPFATLFPGPPPPTQSVFGAAPSNGTQQQQQNPYGASAFGSPYNSQPQQSPFGQNPQQPSTGPYGQNSPPNTGPYAQNSPPNTGPYGQSSQPNLGMGMPNPAALQMFLNAQGQMAPGQQQPFMNSTGPTVIPAIDSRPIEERFQEELRQLNDMGFIDYHRNIAALRRTGGNVNAAIEMLLSGGAL